jgi:hypothetical protein
VKKTCVSVRLGYLPLRELLTIPGWKIENGGDCFLNSENDQLDVNSTFSKWRATYPHR